MLEVYSQQKVEVGMARIHRTPRRQNEIEYVMEWTRDTDLKKMTLRVTPLTVGLEIVLWPESINALRRVKNAVHGFRDPSGFVTSAVGRVLLGSFSKRHSEFRWADQVAVTMLMIRLVEAMQYSGPHRMVVRHSYDMRIDDEHGWISEGTALQVLADREANWPKPRR